MLKKAKVKKIREKNSKKHQQEIRVGGAKDGSISNMNIGDKLKILVDIANSNIVKDVYKNSPFDKKSDGTYFTISNTNSDIDINSDILSTIKLILMCIYLGTDESYYYLVNRFKTIDTSYIDFKVFPDIAIYSITNNNHFTKYIEYADKIFEDLKLKLSNYNTDGKTVVVNKNGNLSNIDYYIYDFIENFYKFRIYFQPSSSNILYVPFKYYNLTKIKNKENLITKYTSTNTNSLNNNFRKVENSNIKNIIEDIKNYTTEYDNIIFIEQKNDKTLKYPEKFTGTMIIDFLNSLYTTPIINDKYDKYIKGQILEYNTYFFVELFINYYKEENPHNNTLTKLLQYLRRAAIGNYRDKEDFMKIVKRAIYKVYDVKTSTLLGDDLDLYNKIETDVNLKIIGRDLLCENEDNILGFQSIIFYSFMIVNNNFNTDDIIIDKLKSISKIEESIVRISQKKGIKDCDKIITDIVSNKEFLLGFSLYTEDRIEKFTVDSLYYDAFKTIANKVKDELNPNYSNIVKNYNKSINTYVNIYSSDQQLIKNRELKYIV
jgi:hypothetical protein